ncbi:hypothetical protein LZL87_012967 [Fusarium oxysporum]|nr:hypothetical protein LZL87_012967 [Fusarium oxysporum]
MSSVATSMPAFSKLPLDEESPASASPAGTLTSNLTKTIRDANHGVTHVPPYEVVDGCCTWHWTDKFSEAEGWIVIDSPVPFVSGTLTALVALYLSLNCTALASTSSNIGALLEDSVGDTSWSVSEYFELADYGARFILAGANNVLNRDETQHEMLGKLDSTSVLMLPERVSNSGTSNLFMQACSGLALKGYSTSSLEACASDSRAFVNAIFNKVGNGPGTKTLWEACENLAVTRRRTGAVNLLGVKRMSHLTLTTPNVARAIQTITQVYNARVNQDGSLYQLPGSGDRTLSIVQAPRVAGPGEIGLSVHFSVYSLEKARGVLRAENIAFEERALKDGSLGLVLGREPAGYPIRLRQVPA